MMDQPVKFNAAGRKGEEAIDVDISSMLVGDWLTIIVQGEPEPFALRMLKESETEFRITAPAWADVEAGETYAQAGQAYDPKGREPGFTRIELRRKRDPKADLEKAKGGEFTT